MTEENYAAYAALLQDIPIEILKAAVEMVAAQGGEFFPPAPVIRRAAISLLQPAHPPIGEAWGMVVAALSEFDPDTAPHFDDQMVQAAVQSMGWRAFCLSEETDRSIWYGQFQKIYTSMLERARDDALVPASIASARANLIQQKQLQSAVSRLALAKKVK